MWGVVGNKMGPVEFHICILYLPLIYSWEGDHILDLL